VQIEIISDILLVDLIKTLDKSNSYLDKKFVALKVAKPANPAWARFWILVAVHISIANKLNKKSEKMVDFSARLSSKFRAAFSYFLTIKCNWIHRLLLIKQNMADQKISKPDFSFKWASTGQSKSTDSSLCYAQSVYLRCFGFLKLFIKGFYICAA
jgi:hypothetical protein